MGKAKYGIMNCNPKDKWANFKNPEKENSYSNPSKL